MEIFEDKVQALEERIYVTSGEVRQILQRDVLSETTLSEIPAIEHDLMERSNIYENIHKEFSKYLLRTNTKESCKIQE